MLLKSPLTGAFFCLFSASRKTSYPQVIHRQTLVVSWADGGERASAVGAHAEKKGVAIALCTGYSQATTKRSEGRPALWLLITTIFCTLLAVVCAIVSWQQASRCSRTTKRLRDVELETSELTLAFESLLESHKRLRSRAGMRELRAREEAPPVESKADARRRLFAGASGPAFAKKQLQIASADR